MKHLIKFESVAHGVVSVKHNGNDSQYCEAGETVKIKWQPDAGWGLQEVHYTPEGGEPVTIEDGEFTMPSANITIDATFKKFVIGDWTSGKNAAENAGKVLGFDENGNIVPVNGGPTPPPYTPNPRFDIDTILSGYPLGDKSYMSNYIGDALGYPFDAPDGFNDAVSVGGFLLLGNYYYSGPSEDLSLPAPFTVGNYVCFITFGKGNEGYIARLYMAPVETMAFKEVAALEYSISSESWNVTPVN